MLIFGFAIKSCFINVLLKQDTFKSIIKFSDDFTKMRWKNVAEVELAHSVNLLLVVALLATPCTSLIATKCCPQHRKLYVNLPIVVLSFKKSMFSSAGICKTSKGKVLLKWCLIQEFTDSFMPIYYPS